MESSWRTTTCYFMLQSISAKCYSEQSSRAQDKVTCDKLSSERDVAG